MRFVSLLDKIPPAHTSFGHTWSGVAVSDAVYFQTRRAIYRWDGKKVDVWTTSESARFYKVFAVRDVVYVARENMGLHRIVDGRLEPVPGGERFAETSVATILPYGEDGLLIGTVTSRLFLRRGDRIERFRTEIDAFLSTNELYTAAALPSGNYAFATLWGGVVITDRDGRALRILDKRAGLIGDDVKALYVDQQDGLWMAYESGIARAEIMLPISMFDERTGLDGVALSITRHNGDLHVGTTSGVFRLARTSQGDGTVRPAFQRVTSLRAQAFSLLSHESGLLAATDRGVFQLRGRRARPVGESRTAYGLHASRHTDGLVYVGYIDGVGAMQYRRGRWESRPPIAGLERGIFFLEEDDRGDLWAASAYGGLWNVSTSDGLRNQPTVTEIASEGQRPQHVFRMAYVAGQGLRIVSRDGVAQPNRDETGRIRLEPDTSLTARLPRDAGRVLNLTAAPDGDLWVTAQAETYWFDRSSGEGLVKVPFAYVPEFNAYASLAEAGGRFWIVGEEGVVSHRPTGTMREPTPVRTLIRSVSLIRTDSLLFGGNAPVEPNRRGRVGNSMTGVDPALTTDPATPSPSADSQSWRLVARATGDILPAGNAVPTRSIHAGSPHTGDASAWAEGDAHLESLPLERAAQPSPSGVSRSARSMASRTEAPNESEPAEASSETSSSRRASSRPDAVIAYADNAVRVEFAAPGFGQEENVEYQYRLDGFDDDWSAWSNEAKKEYTNLPPGRYQFDVRARNPRVWTATTAHYAFEVLPPWYRTLWAYAAYAFLMGGLVFGVVQWRSAQLERRAEALEDIIARRTAEVKEQARQLEVYNTELVRSNEVLQETVEEKSKLLGVAAHDLKNPLFGIRALSEVLLERGDMDENVDRKLNLIRSSADETLKLINDLLASAASSAQARAEMEMIDAGALAEWVAHSFQHQAERKNQRLTAAVPAAPCIVEADKRKLREAMNNLISNAIKYSPHGAPILVRVERDGDEIRFSVEDRGPGLSREDQQRLFAPFQRLTPEPTGDEGSSGLGLYIVKQIAELHDGDVYVDTEVGEGSTFTLTIPAASAGPRRSRMG
jgi:signal transduction histidine kinase